MPCFYYHITNPLIPFALLSFPPLNVTCLSLGFKRPRHGAELPGSSQSIYDLKNLIHTETTELLELNPKVYSIFAPQNWKQ